MIDSAAVSSRRSALALLPGAGLWLPAALKAAVQIPPVRLAISESLVVGDVSLNDARASMTIWLKRMMLEMNVVIELNPKVFDTTEEILRRARTGDFDCVAMNIVEYRQVAEFLDPSQVITARGEAGMDRYLLLAKRDNGIRRPADLKGRTLFLRKHPKMCVAKAWLSTLLGDEGSVPSEQFFKSVTESTKPVRVILPVFFGSADACLTYGQSFETMCELNPQVGKALTAIATSPAMVVNVTVFRRNFHGAGREAFLKAYTDLPSSVAGRQVETLFQVDGLEIRDASCLAPALAILDKAARAGGGASAGAAKG